MLRNAESDIERTGYYYERRLLDAVRRGVYASEKEKLFQNTSGEFGTLAAQPMKQAEYMCVSAVTLYTRAAIEGGVRPIEAYAVSDLLLQKLEKTRTQMEIMKLADEAAVRFSGMVSEVNRAVDRTVSTGSGCVERCKDYIIQHISRPLRVSGIAESLGVNRSKVNPFVKTNF